ncbi:unnamed protein product [Prunus armeniaca]
MKKLRSLRCIESEGSIIRLIGNVTQLTSLAISNAKERDEKDLCASIQEMKVLSHLYLSVADGEEFLRVDALSSPSSYLDRLDLIGKLEKIPMLGKSCVSVEAVKLRFLDLRNLSLLNKMTIEKGSNLQSPYEKEVCKDATR